MRRIHKTLNLEQIRILINKSSNTISKDVENSRDVENFEFNGTRANSFAVDW